MHHYTEHITVDDIKHADDIVAGVCEDYNMINRHQLLPNTMDPSAASNRDCEVSKNAFVQNSALFPSF